MKYLNNIQKLRILKVPNSLLELEKDLKDRELKDREIKTKNKIEELLNQ